MGQVEEITEGSRSGKQYNDIWKSIEIKINK